MALKDAHHSHTPLRRSFSTPAVRSMAQDTTQQPAPTTGKKKRNKKKKKTTSTAVTSTNTLTNSAKAAAAVGEYTEILLTLCGFCKFDQIVCYCDTLLHHVSTTNTSYICANTEKEMMTLRTSLYGATREIFGKGVSGEERNIQPGDELLLQNSAKLRRRLIADRKKSSDSSNSNSISNSAVEQYVTALHWASVVEQGIQASPYSFALKIDELEPFRALAMGEAASALYIEMNPRHIQVSKHKYSFYFEL